MVPVETVHWTFDECIDKIGIDKCQYKKHQMIPYFCGHKDFCLVPSERSVEEAKKNIIKYYSIVGYLEENDKFLHSLEILWPQFFGEARRVYFNIMTNRGIMHKTNHETPSLKAVEIGRRYLKYEFELYNFVKSRFECTYTQLTSNM
jgi:hypothetical protein